MKKKWFIVFGIILAVVAVLYFVGGYLAQSAVEAIKPTAQTTEMKYGLLIKSVGASGVVESDKTYNVYSTLSFSVERVFVEEGQYVNKGEVLAKLDTESLELDIRQQVASLKNTETTADTDISSKLKAYENAVERYALNEESSKRTYDLLASQVRSGAHPEIVSAQNSVDNAKLSLDNAIADLENKQKGHDDNEILYNLDEISLRTLENSFSTLEAAQRAHENAQRAYDTAVTNQQNVGKRLNDEVETARKNYESTKVTSNQEIENAKWQYDNALTTDSTEPTKISIEKLEKQLRDSTITAPISGTITKVYAKEGSPGSGLLFIIEDLQSLEIVTKVKEYDAASVLPGMLVIIKSDATGEREIRGTVKSIAPTSEKNSAGVAIAANVVEYVTIVTVDEPDSGLKIGMNTRLSIVLEHRDNVLYVPYDSIAEDDYFGYKLYTIDEVIEGNRTLNRVRAIPVGVGLETEFSVEVFGAGISKGLPIVSDPTTVEDGIEVKLR
ncbi:MAG: efflux RND transporter periplasmic adaptor subunit [Oscillospiraceae bacterium]|nr:efflux RND transporter periplasmic adaptor subunit [Oscillospiraceae bacterium]